MARGPRWVPVRAVAVPSQGAPPMATSISPARRSSGVRQTGSFMKVLIPLKDVSVGRLTTIGPGARAGAGGASLGDSGTVGPFGNSGCGIGLLRGGEGRGQVVMRGSATAWSRSTTVLTTT